MRTSIAMLTMTMIAAIPVTGAIRVMEIRDTEPIYVFTHPEATTTVIFPFDCTHAQGVGFIDQETLQGMKPEQLASIDFDYVYYFQNPRMLTIYPTREKIPYRNLNVFTADSMWVVEPANIEEAVKADTKLTLLLAARSGEAQSNETSNPTEQRQRGSSGIKVSRTNAPAARQSQGLLTKEQLVGFLQLTQFASMLEPDALDQLREERPDFEYAETDLGWESETHDVRVYLVVRDRKADANGFFGIIENRTGRDLSLDRESTIVMVGDERHVPVVMDLPRSIPAGGTAPFWIATYRQGGAMRANLDVNNAFRVMIPLKG